MIIDVFAEFGNGDPLKGERILTNIAKTIQNARKKHPKKEWQNMLIHEACVALISEVEEVLHAVDFYPDESIIDELQDVIAVAIRIINKEYKE